MNNDGKLMEFEKEKNNKKNNDGVNFYFHSFFRSIVKNSKYLTILHFIVTTLRTLFFYSIYIFFGSLFSRGLNRYEFVRDKLSESYVSKKVLFDSFIFKFFFFIFPVNSKWNFIFYSIFLTLIGAVIYFFDNLLEEEISIKSLKISKNLLFNKFRNLSILDRKNEKNNFNILIESDSSMFSKLWEHLPNHIYHSLLRLFFILIDTILGREKVFSYYNLFFVFSLSLINYISYFFGKIMSKRRKKRKEISKKEDLIFREEIENSILIENMGLTDKYKDKQLNFSEKVMNYDIITNRISLLSSSIVYEFLYDVLPIFLMLFNNFKIEAIIRFRSASSDVRSLVKCFTNDYSNFLISSSRINNFLSLPEINDEKKEKIIFDNKDKINYIEFSKVNYSYPGNSVSVLKNYNKKFCLGDLNKLNGENGSGKSTIMQLILGTINPDEGEIIIKDSNNKIYNLKDIDRRNWRKNYITYLSHDNISKGNRSTGQKQWDNINYLLEEKKETKIFLFDEAGNALDEKFRSKLEELIKKIMKDGKLVIYVDHVR